LLAVLRFRSRHHRDGRRHLGFRRWRATYRIGRDYATQSGDTASLEPDNANGYYDADKEELHLVVPTRSPQEVAGQSAKS